MEGFSDLPIEKMENDCFGLSGYVQGLSEYILKCDTPTTIAIQGDWGSGKTSMLNMVKGQLGDKVKAIWFNTWQYSKFNMDDKLSLSLLTHLCMALAKEDKSGNSEKLNKRIALLAKAGVKLGSYVIDMLGAQKLAEDFGNLDRYGDSADIIETIESLKVEFQEAIDRIYQSEHKRVVVFIDDLDRLSPSNALDLMEVLKLFLDCENCVYVLAIDYDVVTRGINEKYGEDFGKKQGRKFFDKIIQVPFFVPVEQYNIKEYLKKSMPKEIQLHEQDISQYIELIRNSVGCNPRAMKRLFNAYLLTCMIYKNKYIDKDIIKQKLLFAVLCMQMSMEQVYQYFVEHIAENGNNFCEKFLDKNGSDQLADYLDGLIMDGDELDEGAAIRFLSKMSSIMVGEEGHISDENLKKLQDIFKIASNTNNTTIYSPKGGANVMDENKVVDKIVNQTDAKYKILTAGSRLHIGFGQNVTIVYNDKEYATKMHNTSKGRIDGLTDFYKDSEIQEGDRLQLSYEFDSKKIFVKKL